jgi:hypothetical protein
MIEVVEPKDEEEGVSLDVTLSRNEAKLSSLSSAALYVRTYFYTVCAKKV